MSTRARYTGALQHGCATTRARATCWSHLRFDHEEVRLFQHGQLREAAFVEPMLLLQADRLPEGDAWQYELKFDGYRALAIKTGGKILLRSRNDNDFSLR